MSEDIASALAYQIKREIAERYFGARKSIEDRTEEVNRNVDYLLSFYERRLVPDLVRIYSILIKKAAIDSFLEIIGWEGDPPYYDEYVVESKTIRARLIKDMEERGWTAFRRYYYRLLDSYDQLFYDLKHYHAKRDELMDEAAELEEEITAFCREFDISEIMSFLNSLDSPDISAGIPTDIINRQEMNLEACLAVKKQPDLSAILPYVPDIPDADAVMSRLKEIAESAFETR